jgi:hypothetical protein
MYTLYYASQDTEGGTWTVYSEKYERIDSPEPIDNSTMVVSRNHTEQSAHELADARQRRSYAENRKKARTDAAP